MTWTISPGNGIPSNRLQIKDGLNEVGWVAPEYSSVVAAVPDMLKACEAADTSDDVAMMLAYAKSRELIVAAIKKARGL